MPCGLARVTRDSNGYARIGRASRADGREVGKCRPNTELQARFRFSKLRLRASVQVAQHFTCCSRGMAREHCSICHFRVPLFHVLGLPSGQLPKRTHKTQTCTRDRASRHGQDGLLKELRRPTL